MPYAVMQKSLEPPTVAQLKNAFRGIPGLTPMDAYTLGKDAFCEEIIWLLWQLARNGDAGK